MTQTPTVPTPDELRARLEALRGSRGFLLPHHGAMAAFAPDLHEAYSQMYAAVTLTERHLSPIDKETVWLGILTAVREAIGTHHLDLFRKLGGTPERAATVFQLVGYAGAAPAFSFVAAHWQKEFPALDPAVAYMAGVDRLCAGKMEPSIAHLTLIAIHAALGQHWGVAAHLGVAYATSIPEDMVAEALSLVIWPCGVNRFVEACTVWHELMRSGKVSPSPRYRSWADVPGQGAFETGRG